MDDIVFHSLYSEGDLKYLKHSLLYFNNVTIPINSYGCEFGEKHPYPHYLQLVPESVYDQIEYLGKHNLVNIHEFGGGEHDNILKYYNAIEEGAINLGGDRNYTNEQIYHVANYLKIDLNHPELFLIVNEVTTFLAAICLMEFSVHQRVCCNDNIIIHDAMNLGIKRALQTAGENINKENSKFRELKRNIFAYKVLSLNLPSFEFQTFDDIYEIKEKHKDELLALDNHLDDLTEKIDKSPYDEGFDDELKSLMAHRIQPEIDNLYKSISFSPSRIVKNTFKPLLKFGLAFGFSCCFPDYAREIVIGTATNVVGELFNDFNETRKKIKESPYNIFLEFKQ